jgi:hypothetical protein
MMRSTLRLITIILMMVNSRIRCTDDLIAYGITLIGVLFVFTIIIEEVNAQEPAELDDHQVESIEPRELPEEVECDEDENPVDTDKDGINDHCVAKLVPTLTPKYVPDNAQSQPIPGQDNAQSQPIPGQDNAQSQPIPGQDNAQSQPIPGQDNIPLDTGSSNIIGPLTILTSTTDGFHVQVPDGWVVEDIDNTNITAQTGEQQTGYTFLARICPQDNALPFIGGVGIYQCEEGSNATVHIMRFSDLYESPEFASLRNRYINTSDLLSYYIQFWQRNAGISNIEIWNNTDTIVNVRNAETNQVVAAVPAKLIEYTYIYSPDGNTRTQYREFTLLVLNGATGYTVYYEGLASSLPSGRPPSQVQQIFNSFGLLF